MQLCLTTVGARLRPAPALQPRSAHLTVRRVRGPSTPGNRHSMSGAVHRFSVRCDSDDEIVPIVSGRTKKGFTKEEYEQLRNPQLLGGATIGEELALIRKRYLTAEQVAQKEVAKQTSHNWDGDVYIGGRWNELSILYLIFLAVPLLGLLFAWATHGTLWDTGVYY